MINSYFLKDLLYKTIKKIENDNTLTKKTKQIKIENLINQSKKINFIDSIDLKNEKIKFKLRNKPFFSKSKIFNIGFYKNYPFVLKPTLIYSTVSGDYILQLNTSKLLMRIILSYRCPLPIIYPYNENDYYIPCIHYSLSYKYHAINEVPIETLSLSTLKDIYYGKSKFFYKIRYVSKNTSGNSSDITCIERPYMVFGHKNIFKTNFEKLRSSFSSNILLATCFSRGDFNPFIKFKGYIYSKITDNLNFELGSGILHSYKNIFPVEKYRYVALDNFYINSVGILNGLSVSGITNYIASKLSATIKNEKCILTHAFNASIFCQNQNYSDFEEKGFGFLTGYSFTAKFNYKNFVFIFNIFRKLNSTFGLGSDDVFLTLNTYYPDVI